MASWLGIAGRATAIASLMAMAASVDPVAAIAPPTITISDATVNEPNTGKNIVIGFKLTLSRSATSTVAFITGDSSATAGSDYVAKSGSVSFVKGLATTKKVKVTVKGDNLDEVDETFGVTLIAVKNVTISDGTAVGTINDNDGPSISVADAISDEYSVVNEGAAGQTDRRVRFNVKLSAASPQQVTVNAASALDSAGLHSAATTDFIALASTPVNFAPGETSKQVDVHINGDWEDESDETFLLNLSSAVDATISDGQAVGTIPDDDCVGTDPGATSAVDLGSYNGDDQYNSTYLSRTGAISCLGEADWYKVTLKDASAACTLYNSRYLTAHITWQDDGVTQGGPGVPVLQILKTNGTVVVTTLGPTAWPHGFYLWKTDWCSGVDDTTTVWLRYSLNDNSERGYDFQVYPSGPRPTNGALEISLD